jgi:hypothetical protein
MLVLVGAVVLCAPTIYNGYPFFFYDTHAYYTGGQKSLDFLIRQACHAGFGCSGSLHAESVDSGVSESSGAAAEPTSQSGTISTGRSPFYGVILYLADKLGTVWLMVAVQALVASWLLYLCCWCLVPDHCPVVFLCALVLVTALTSLPFFVGYLMPDVFAGLCILAMALMLVLYDRFTPVERTMLWMLVLCSMLFHRSHVLAGGMLLGLVVLYVFIFATKHLQRAAPALLASGAAVVIGAVGFVMVDSAVSRITGLVATPPPFLLARVIEDGPGTSYLRQACAEKRYAVCRFVHRMPIDSGTFLWSKEPEEGVWYVVSPEERAQMAHEQYAIVFRSFLHAPLMQIAAIAGNFWHQLANFGVSDFEVKNDLKDFIGNSFGGSIADRFRESRAARNEIDLGALSALHAFVAFTSFLLLAIRFRTLKVDTKAVFAVILTSIILNALVTGSLSAAVDRYQARVIWLLPFLAAVVEIKRLTEQAGRRPPRSRDESHSFGSG